MAWMGNLPDAGASTRSARSGIGRTVVSEVIDERFFAIDQSGGDNEYLDVVGEGQQNSKASYTEEISTKAAAGRLDADAGAGKADTARAAKDMEAKARRLAMQARWEREDAEADIYRESSSGGGRSAEAKTVASPGAAAGAAAAAVGAAVASGVQRKMAQTVQRGYPRTEHPPVKELDDDGVGNGLGKARGGHSREASVGHVMPGESANAWWKQLTDDVGLISDDEGPSRLESVPGSPVPPPAKTDACQLGPTEVAGRVGLQLTAAATRRLKDGVGRQFSPSSQSSFAPDLAAPPTLEITGAAAKRIADSRRAGNLGRIGAQTGNGCEPSGSMKTEPSSRPTSTVAWACTGDAPRASVLFELDMLDAVLDAETDAIDAPESAIDVTRFEHGPEVPRGALFAAAASALLKDAEARDGAQGLEPVGAGSEDRSGCCWGRARRKGR